MCPGGVWRVYGQFDDPVASLDFVLKDERLKGKSHKDPT